jgi:hypothetical protein
MDTISQKLLALGLQMKIKLSLTFLWNSIFAKEFSLKSNGGLKFILDS